MNLKYHFLYLILVLHSFSCRQQQEDPTPVEAFAVQPEEHYLVGTLGDTIPSGVAIPGTGKYIDPDSVDTPQSIPLTAEPKVVYAHPNVHPGALPRVVPITTPPAAKGAAAPATIPAKGKVVRAGYPPPVQALPPKMKDAAIGDIRYFDLDQGMSSFNVSAILEDSHGNLWFGTNTGVSRYDGNSFTHFTKKEGLSSNNVLSIMEDSKGHFWFGTFDGGVSHYNGEQFVHYTEKNGLNNKIIRAILEDSNGHIWLGTHGGGANRFIPNEDGSGGSFSHYTIRKGLSSNIIFTILEDRNQHLWFGTVGGGLCRYDGNGFTCYTKKEGLVSNIVLTIIEDRKGDIWCAADGGVSRFDGKRFFNYTVEQGLSSNVVRSMLEDSQGNIWLGTRAGANQFDGQDFTHYTEAEGLSHNDITSIYEDSSGKIWFGTSSGGVNWYDSRSFRYLTEKNGLSSNYVTTILEDRRGNIWCGTADRGLSSYNDTTFTSYLVEEGLISNQVQSLLEDNRGDLWIGSHHGGVTRFDLPDNQGSSREQGSFTHYTTKEGLSYNSVTSIVEDRQGVLWFSTLGGLSRFQPPAQDLTTGSLAAPAAGTAGPPGFTHFTEKEGLGSNLVKSISEDSRGNLWIATDWGGVSRYRPSIASSTTGSFTNYTEKEGLNSNYVSLTVEDQAGNLWFATSNGLCRYDGNSFENIRNIEDLDDNWVGSVLEDRENNLWVSTQKGIVLFKKISEMTTSDGGVKQANYQTITLGKSDGLKQLNLGTGLIDSRNRIWWGGPKGLTMLDLERFELPTESPEGVQLSHIDVQQQFVNYRRLADTAYRATLPFGEALRVSFDSVAPFYNYPVNLKLPFNINHLSFHFTAIDWAGPHKIKYSYKLEGLEKEWSIAQSEAKADYRNLPHGNYTLQVRAIGIAQVWSQTFGYQFTILPPWWATWWARTLYAVAGFFLISLIVRYRTASLKKRQRHLEKTVADRTAEVRAQKEELALKNNMITKEKDRSEELLLNILPAETAEELKQYGSAKAKNYDMVTVLFTDFKGFTMHSERLSPEALVAEIDHCFKAFDHILEQHQVEKIKTVGDAYLAAAGLPTPNTSNPLDAVKAALAIRDFMLRYKCERKAQGREAFEVRIGVHTGPLVAGIVGIKKFAYDIWGDTVNLAARMESSGEVGKVNISHSTYGYLKDHPDFTFIARGKVKAKNKGEVEMYFVENAPSAEQQPS